MQCISELKNVFVSFTLLKVRTFFEFLICLENVYEKIKKVKELLGIYIITIYHLKRRRT